MALFPALERRADDGLDRSETSDFWFQIVDYLKTSSGVNISEQSALNVTAVFSCINLISKHIGSMPLQVYERLGDDRKRVAADHPLYPILHTRPNPEMTSMAFRSTVQAHLLGWGTYYANIVWSQGYRRVLALWPLRPDRIKTGRNASTGELEYLYTLPGGEQRVLSNREVLRVNSLGFGGLTGYSPIIQGKEAIGLAVATEKHGSLFFSNGAIPGLALVHPGKLSQEAHDRLRDSWAKAHKGIDNKHRLAILEEGIDIKEIGINPELSQFLETRRYQVEEIARLYNLPLHKISDLSRATFNNIEHLSQEYLTDCLLPHAVQNEQSYNHDLFTKKDRGRFYAEHNFEGLLRGDSKARSEFYRSMFNIGAFSPNMILSKENMNPIGEEGDFHMVQLNMVPLKSYLNQPVVLPPTSEPNAAEEPVTGAKSRSTTPILEARTAAVKNVRMRLRDRHYPLLRETSAQIVARENRTIRQYINKLNKTGNRDEFLKNCNDFYADTFPEYIRTKVQPVISVYADALGTSAQSEIGVEPTEESDDRLAQFVTGYTNTYIARHIQSSRGQLEDIVSNVKPDNGTTDENELDLSSLLETRVGEWDEKRPDKIAADEVVRLDGAVAVLVFTNNGYRLRWIAIGDNCPYCQVIDGTVIGKDEYFLKQDQELKPDGHDPMHVRFSKQHPPAHQGCDCMLMAAQ